MKMNYRKIGAAFLSVIIALSSFPAVAYAGTTDSAATYEEAEEQEESTSVTEEDSATNASDAEEDSTTTADDAETQESATTEVQEDAATDDTTDSSAVDDVETSSAEEETEDTTTTEDTSEETADESVDSSSDVSINSEAADDETTSDGQTVTGEQPLESDVIFSYAYSGSSGSEEHYEVVNRIYSASYYTAFYSGKNNNILPISKAKNIPLNSYEFYDEKTNSSGKPACYFSPSAYVTTDLLLQQTMLDWGKDLDWDEGTEVSDVHVSIYQGSYFYDSNGDPIDVFEEQPDTSILVTPSDSDLVTISNVETPVEQDSNHTYRTYDFDIDPSQDGSAICIGDLPATLDTIFSNQTTIMATEDPGPISIETEFGFTVTFSTDDGAQYVLNSPMASDSQEFELVADQFSVYEDAEAPEITATITDRNGNKVENTDSVLPGDTINYDVIYDLKPYIQLYKEYKENYGYYPGTPSEELLNKIEEENPGVREKLKLDYTDGWSQPYLTSEHFYRISLDFTLPEGLEFEYNPNDFYSRYYAETSEGDPIEDGGRPGNKYNADTRTFHLDLYYTNFYEDSEMPDELNAIFHIPAIKVSDSVRINKLYKVKAKVSAQFEPESGKECIIGTFGQSSSRFSSVQKSQLGGPILRSVGPPAPKSREQTYNYDMNSYLTGYYYLNPVETEYAVSVNGIEIHKNVPSLEDEDKKDSIDENKEYSFTLALYDQKYDGQYAQGSVVTFDSELNRDTYLSSPLWFTSSEDSDGTSDVEANFTLKNGQRQIVYLRSGTKYKITEQDGYDVSHENISKDIADYQTMVDGVETTTSSGEVQETTIGEDESAKTLTDVYYDNYPLGRLSIQKVVSRFITATDKDKKFHFNITLTGGEGETIEKLIVPLQIGDEKTTLTFIDGKTTVDLKAGEKATIIGLPAGLSYKVTEESDGDFWSEDSSYEGKIADDKVAKVVVTNTRKTGDLSISKKFAGNATADDYKKTFHFTVELDGSLEKDTYPMTIGDTTYSLKFADGKATVDLKAGEIATITGLPAGVSYSVTETADDDFTTEATNDAGTITANKTTAVVFTNTRKNGALSVSKKLAGNTTGGDLNKIFHFTVELNDKQDETTYPMTIGDTTSVLKFTNGKAKLNLKGGETATITDIPSGVTYKVKETADENFTTETTVYTGDIVADETTAVTFTNTRKSGALSITKKLDGNTTDEDLNKTFHFTVELSDKQDEAVYPMTIGDTTTNLKFTNGKAELDLKNGETANIANIPSEVTYKVTETADDNFSIDATADTGSIVADETTAVIFTNIRKTGDLSITKKLAGNTTSEDLNTTFHFTIELSDKRDSVTYPMTIGKKRSDLKFTNGKAKLDLKGGKTATITGLPSGITYKVTETAAENFSGAATNDEGTIAADTTTTVSFTNTRNAGNLSITKKLAGNTTAEDLNKTFHFTVKLNAELEKYTYPMTIGDTKSEIRFTDGKAGLDLKANETATITGLPSGITYQVTETADSNFGETAVNDTGEIVTDKTQDVTFTNIRKTGDLSIIKKLAGNTTAEDLDTTFHFTVELTGTLDKDTYPMTIGDTTSDLKFTDSKAEFDLKAGETATITGLPAGISYQVTETADSNFTTESSNEESVIAAETIQKVTFTNTRKTGDLSISKKLAGNTTAEDLNKTFKFTVELSDKQSEAAYPMTIGDTTSDLKFTNGKAEVDLKAGETATITGIPSGVTYKVTETADDSFTSEISDAEGNITADETAEVVATNTRKTGDISITKKLAGNTTKEDLQKTFHFTVELDAELENDTYPMTIGNTTTEIKFTDGKAELDLKAGETATITGLPSGITYKVTETADSDFSAKSSNDEGEIVADKTAEVTFTNTKIPDEKTTTTNHKTTGKKSINRGSSVSSASYVKTGDTTNIALYIVIIAAAVVVILIIRKKRQHDRA
jgi:uncharacterized protein YifN (PemK superfamily)